ncbi:MAG TPA: IclR family transcriptional regulator [Microbacteriaceae bacterium]|nr:IclR family transcriptional regulator [Microbacteriaceae bacterium]
MPRNADDARTGAERLFAVLDAFDLDDVLVLTATEIGRRAQLPVSTAHRLAEQCVAWGGLERAPGGGYQVGVKLWLLGLHSNRIPMVRQAAAPVLEQLHESTGHQVQIGVRDARTALCLRFLPNRDVEGERPWLGWNVPLHCTGAGLVLLAFADPEVADAVLAAPLRRFTPNTVTAPAEIRTRLARIRRTGLIRTRGEYMAGADSVAVPIRDQSGHVTAALSMIIPADAAEPEQYDELVVRAGLAISADLGWAV